MDAGRRTATPCEVADRSWSRTGVRHLLYTDIGRDGTLGGPNLDARMRRLAEAAPPLRLIASGGISSLDDLRAPARPGRSRT